MGTAKNRSIVDKINTWTENRQTRELFVRYGAGIYGIVFRTLGCPKRSDEILMKIFLRINEMQLDKKLKIKVAFPALLAVAMSMLSACKIPPAADQKENKKTLDDLISLSLSSAKDKHSLGKAIREQLSAFKKN